MHRATNKYLYKLLTFLVTTCTQISCQNDSLCNTDFDTPICKCLIDWVGYICNSLITSENSDLLLSNLNSVISLIDNKSEISNEQINTISSYENMLAKFDNIIPDELLKLVYSLLNGQINLLLDDKIDVNPNLLNLIDLSLNFAMYYIYFIK